MMNDLVSIIIPAYNASARIKLALESVIAQDYMNIEVIAVDDASNDDTGKIAHEVLSRSSFTYRIITHERNKGVSAARNTGIESAHGKYICFMDADDIIRENFISCLHSAIVKGECDISFCGLTDTFTDGRPGKDIHYARENQNVSGENLIIRGNVPPVYCCMYSREFIARHNLRFHEGCISGEDIEFVMRALCMAGKISFTPECLYMCVHHKGMGSIRRREAPRYEDNTLAQIRTAEYISERSTSESLRAYAENILMPGIVARMFKLCAMKNDRENYDLMLRDRNMRDILKRALSFHVLAKKTELFFKAFMILHMPGVYFMLRKGSRL